MNEGNNEDNRIARVSLACPSPYHFHLVDEELKGQSLMRLRWEIVASHLQSQRAHGVAQNLCRVCGVVIVLRRGYRVTKGDRRTEWWVAQSIQEQSGSPGAGSMGAPS